MSDFSVHRPRSGLVAFPITASPDGSCLVRFLEVWRRMQMATLGAEQNEQVGRERRLRDITGARYQVNF